MKIKWKEQQQKGKWKEKTKEILKSEQEINYNPNQIIGENEPNGHFSTKCWNKRQLQVSEITINGLSV